MCIYIGMYRGVRDVVLVFQNQILLKGHGLHSLCAQLSWQDAEGNIAADPIARLGG